MTQKGDQVVAVKDVGDIARELVPKGSRGVVVACGLFSDTRVVFTVKGGFLGSDKTVEIRVETGEIQ
jgi:hypothetical protein